MAGGRQAGGALTIGEIAKLTQAQLPPHASADLPIRNIAPLDTAGPTDIAFVEEGERDPGALADTHAGACFVPPRLAASAPRRVAVLSTADPYRAFVLTARALFPDALRAASLFGTVGRAGRARVHETARVETGVTVDPLALIGPRAEIGAGTLVAAGAVVGPDVRIGRHCAVGAGASVLHALVGDRVIIQPGARIGQDGIGRSSATRAGGPKMPRIGRVIIQDDAEIGANATIDRGSIGDTVIGEGTRVANLVQIPSDSRIGRHCLIMARSGIPDGVTVDDFVVTALDRPGENVA